TPAMALWASALVGTRTVIQIDAARIEGRILRTIRASSSVVRAHRHRFVAGGYRGQRQESTKNCNQRQPVARDPSSPRPYAQPFAECRIYSGRRRDCPERYNSSLSRNWAATAAWLASVATSSPSRATRAASS